MATFYVRFSGAVPGGEQWATGVHFTGSGDVTAVLPDAVAAAVVLWDGDGALIPGVETHYTPTTTLTSVVVYELDEGNGKATARAEGAVSHVGSGAGSPLPQEVAVCCSLRTALPGPAGRGRSYMPAPIVGDVLSTGRLDSIAVGDFATSVSGWLASMSSQGWQPVLFTPGVTSRDILSVDVGDVFDAQRRRRDKLIETRVSHVV